MQVLVLAEHDGRRVRVGSRSALTLAEAVAGATGGRVTWLVLGHHLEDVGRDAARYAPVLMADCPALASPVADRYARVLADVVAAQRADLLAAASTSVAKDIVARAAALLGGTMASEVIGHELRDGQLLLRRPMYAGAVTATVRLLGAPKVVTVRSSAYQPAPEREAACEIATMPVDESLLPNQIQVERLDSKATGRPDVTEARVVVSGGRALKTGVDFERLVGGLADQLNGGTGSTRALVDAGITPNEFQIGQTGKIVAPELYIALGLSGSVQHLAGMKNSKVIVAINKDPEAPIFDMADYGLIGDVYQVVPELIKLLEKRPSG